MHDIYFFLEEHGLDKKKWLETKIDRMSYDRIERMLEEYASLAEKRVYFPTESGRTNIYPDSAMHIHAKDFLRKLGVYADHIFIHDLLADSLNDLHRINTDVTMVYQLPKRHDRLNVFKRNFLAILRDVLDIRPLVEAGIVSLAPTYLFTRDKSDAIYAKNFLFDDDELKIGDDLSPEELEFVANNMTAVTADMRGKPSGKLSPSRIISIKINGDPSPIGRVLMTGQGTGKTSANGDQLQVMMHLEPEKLSDIDPQEFKKWVEQELKNLFQNRANSLRYDFSIARAANATFLTTLPSSAKLAGVNTSMTPIKEPVIQALMNIDLPYTDAMSMSDLAKARQEEASFQNFRSALQKACSTLENETDIANLQTRANQICQDLIHAPLAEIDRRIRNFKTIDKIAAGFGLASIGFAVFSGGTSLIASAATATIALGAGVVAQKKEHHAIRQLPSIFYWDATKEARKQK